jgi:flagellar hook assembly protein FlgD
VDLLSEINSTVSYRLKQVDTDGSFDYSQVITIDTMLPQQFQLAQNYPNPFNPRTEIRFQLPESNHVNLHIFNALGKEIRILIDSSYEAGHHKAIWDGKDGDGNHVSSGAYLYRIQAGDFTLTKKMLLIR